MATYYVSTATGDDGDSGLTEELAWATIDKAMNSMAGGPHKVYIKADGDYTETATIDHLGVVSAPIEFEGYTTTPGDGGKATIDAEGARAYCIAHTGSSASYVYYIFKNFTFENATTTNVSINGLEVLFKNCEFNSATGDGCACGNPAYFEDCLFDSNGAAGIDAGGYVIIVGCKFINNTAEGVEATKAAWAFYCTFVGNGADAIECLGGNGTFTLVIGCTIDGNAKTTNIGIDLGSSFTKRAAVVNNIVYDCTAGIDCASQGEFFISRNNLLNDNTTDYPGSRFQTLEGEVTSAPQFEDEAGGDYSLGNSSPARDVGFDGYSQNSSDQLRDIGAIESTSAAGAGGGASRALKDGSQLT